ncbi:polygalacturonase-like [Cylas formicarius]|uniref:polygalacturonase-like n=1 Tax=Cylas formicarius TaxID=197179 RepID=UPI0029588DD6|nr:polygalacturonase-like [Cylas formicarius]
MLLRAWVSFCVILFFPRALALDCVLHDFESVQSITKTCTDIVVDNLFVPAGETLALNLLNGSTLTFKGNTSFGYTNWQGYLVKITGNGLTVAGEAGSFLDGLGPLYWDGKGNGGIEKPKFIDFSVTDSVINNLYVLNCPKTCIYCRGCDNVTVTNLTVDNRAGDENVAPPNQYGHNTDGFNLHQSNNIVIKNGTIFNQDDCVCVFEGSNISVSDMYCHGSHGLSISLSSGVVENVLFADSVVEDGENGIHVKIHIPGESGILRNVTYKNIFMRGIIDYGIDVQQNYPDKYAPPENTIPIYNLNLINVTGSVNPEAVPIQILCAQDGCFDWNWSGVDIEGNVAADNCTNYVPPGFRC